MIKFMNLLYSVRDLVFRPWPRSYTQNELLQCPDKRKIYTTTARSYRGHIVNTESYSIASVIYYRSSVGEFYTAWSRDPKSVKRMLDYRIDILNKD